MRIEASLKRSVMQVLNHHDDQRVYSLPYNALNCANEKRRLIQDLVADVKRDLESAAKQGRDSLVVVCLHE